MKRIISIWLMVVAIVLLISSIWLRSAGVCNDVSFWIAIIAFILMMASLIYQGE